MRTKTVTQMRTQIKRIQTLTKELGYEFNVYYFRIINAIDSTCMQRYGYHAHSKELSKYIKITPNYNNI